MCSCLEPVADFANPSRSEDGRPNISEESFKTMRKLAGYIDRLSQEIRDSGDSREREALFRERLIAEEKQIDVLATVYS